MSGLFRRLGPGLLLGLVPLVALGCAKPGTVSGTVTVEGKPLKAGLITFLSEVGNKDPYNATIINGQYTTDLIPAGPTKVIVAPSLGENETTYRGSDLRPPPKESKKQEVPPKYSDPRTSGLEYTVKGGTNTFDVDLKP